MPADAATEKAKRSTVRDNDVFKFKRSLKKDETLSPQASLILSIIEKEGEITRADLVKRLEKELTTKQPAERVLSYYKTPMVNDGFIVVIEAKPEPKAEKPAPAAKPAAAAKPAGKGAKAA